jgi:hypothetical protein
MENTDLKPIPLSLHSKDTPTPFGSWLSQFSSGDGEASEEEKVPKYSIPHEDVNQKDLDALLAKDLNQMTLKEREAMYEELHGVESIIEETPEFVADRLRSLDIELRKIKTKTAYEQAERMSKGYVTDWKFRLMFLRAEHFDAEKAATRLVSFMEGKLEYFGSGALARPLHLTDLDKDDMETLKSGFFQLLQQETGPVELSLAISRDSQLPAINAQKTWYGYMVSFVRFLCQISSETIRY